MIVFFSVCFFSVLVFVRYFFSSVNSIGLSIIDRIVFVSIRFCLVCGSKFNVILSFVRINVNLLICVRLVVMVNVVCWEWLNSCIRKNVVNDLLNRIIVSVVSIVSGCWIRINGLNNILMEIKNSIVNVLCNGSVLWVVWWFSLDLFSIILVKNVLSVKEILNSFIVLKVIFNVSVSIDRVNSLWELVVVLCVIIYGIRWWFISIIMVINVIILLMVIFILIVRVVKFILFCFIIFVIVGSNISVRIIIRFFIIN